MKIFTCLGLFFAIFLSSKSLAQDDSLYQKKVFSEYGDSMPYRILLPKDYDPSKEYPFVLFLHGAGERGNDNESQLIHGSFLFLDDGFRDKYPAIVVFPQCAVGNSWANVDVLGGTTSRKFVFYKKNEPTQQMRLLEGLLKYLGKSYKLDEQRLYVGGLSMGGMGTFELVKRNPKMFAAAFPICGGANPIISKKLRKLDWWVFHGQEDKVVPETYSADMVKAMKKEKINVKYTVYPGVGHNSWDNAFAEPELLPWLFSKSK